MIIERPVFSLFRQEGPRTNLKGEMSESIYQTFSAKNRPNRLSRWSIVNMRQTDFSKFLSYYAASQISPSSREGEYRDLEGIHDMLTHNLFNAMFGPGIPAFEPKQTQVILQKALCMARDNWDAVERNKGLLPLRRLYAKIAVEDINARLGVPEPAIPKTS